MTSISTVLSAMCRSHVAIQTRVICVAICAITAIPLLEPKATAQIQPPSILGDWNVGYQKMKLTEDDGTRRRMDLSLWFPTEADTSLADPATYAHGKARYAVDTDAIANGGPYPLIVYSYGTVGGPTDNSYLAESLASHGFIVAAPSHTSSEYDRPLDIQSLIDVFYDATTQEDHMLYGRVQTDGAGVAGHSFGGYSSIAASIGTNDGQVDADPRVAAIFSLAGGSCCTPEPISIGEIKVPTLMFAGELDDPGRDDRARREIAQLAANDRFVAIVEDTNHWDLGVSRCQQSPASQACSNDEAMRVGATLGVSFFDRYLRDSDTFSDVLSQSYAVQHDPPFEFFTGATADTDRDGRTTFADFLKLSDSFGLTGREARRSRADFNRDDVVDFQDFLYLSLNYTGGGPAQAASVPEPSGRAICSLGAFVLTLCRRRRLRHK